MSMTSTANRRRRSGEGTLSTRHVVLALGYVAAIYGLSSLSSLGAGGHGRAFQVGSKLAHVVMYGGLAFLVLRAVKWGDAARGATWLPYSLAFAASAILAVLDEWHQSFVPGRRASASDLLLDLVGIGGTLLILRAAGASRTVSAVTPHA